jgi:hypothetical protein
MYRFSDQSREAKEWRAEQMHANSAIEGVDKDEDAAALVSQWDAEGLSQDEIVERLNEMFVPRALSVA